MARVEDYTDPYLGTYTAVPAAGSGVCDVCHGCPTSGFARCWSCKQSVESVSYPILLVAPISLYRVSEQLHSVLRSYKDSPSKTARGRYALRVAATLHRFIRDHSACIEREAGGGWDAVTIVPSKSRTGEHPLEHVIKLGKKLKKQHARLLEVDKPDEIDRARGSDHGYRAMPSAKGRRVLLIDDTFTSGATFQSAASALTLGGAIVVAGVPIGRVISTGHPGYPEKDDFWERQRKLKFSFDTCCLE